MARQREDRLGIAGAVGTGRLDRMHERGRRRARRQRGVDLERRVGAGRGDRLARAALRERRENRRAALARASRRPPSRDRRP